MPHKGAFGTVSTNGDNHDTRDPRAGRHAAFRPPTMLQPPVFATSPDLAMFALREQGCATLSVAGLAQTCGLMAADLAALNPAWVDLPPDRHLRDGGRYRYRRHGSYLISPSEGQLAAVPPRAHWQPIEYNALHGGIERWFDPILPQVEVNPAWQSVLLGLGRLFNAVAPADRWHVEAHQFRIDTAGGIGRPTPEGAHRDGVDFVAVLLVARQGIKGGETRVFEAQGPTGVRFTMVEPWSALLLDDARVIHETTPIQPAGEGGHRDTLVLTYRRGGFLGP
jgi:hypothetical protein